MVDKTDYVDITPAALPDGAGGVKNVRGVVFQETEVEQIRGNPGRLTKEGCEEKINIWANSANGHVKIKYKTMLNACKVFTPSGTTEDGKIILSRSKDGTPNWTKDAPPSKIKTKKTL